MSLFVVKVGGAVSGRSAGAVLELAAADDVLVVHGAGPQISAEMERAGVPVEFVDGLRVTPPEGIGIVRDSFMAVNEALCAAIGERAVGLAGDEIGLIATPLPGLGLVGEVEPAELPAVRAALAAGKIPVLAPIARGDGRIAQRERGCGSGGDRDRDEGRPARLPDRRRGLLDRR